MVAKFFNKLIFKIYLLSRNYLFIHNCFVYKDDFDYDFWSDGI